MRKNFILFVSTVTLMLLTTEFVIRNFYPQNFGYYAERDERGLNILRDNILFYHRINKRNVTYKFGEFHNRETHSNINKDYQRILILGDSFTFGWLIEDESTYVSLLQKNFENFYFINPSVPGWGTSDQVMYVENYCKKIKPKKIIVMLNTDDVGRAWWSTLYKYKINDLDNVNNNELTMGYRGPINYDSKYYKIPFFKIIAKNSHTYVLIRQVYIDIKNKKKINHKNKTPEHFPIPDDRSELVKDNFREVNMLGKMLFIRLKKLSEDCGANLIAIYSGWYDYNLRKNTNGTLYFLKNAKKFFKDNNIKFYDFTPNMKKVHNNFNRYLISNDHHPNELGHKIISENIIKFVKLN